MTSKSEDMIYEIMKALDYGSAKGYSAIVLLDAIIAHYEAARANMYLYLGKDAAQTILDELHTKHRTIQEKITQGKGGTFN